MTNTPKSYSKPELIQNPTQSTIIDRVNQLLTGSPKINYYTEITSNDELVNIIDLRLQITLTKSVTTSWIIKIIPYNNSIESCIPPYFSKYYYELYINLINISNESDSIILEEIESQLYLIETTITDIENILELHRIKLESLLEEPNKSVKKIKSLLGLISELENLNKVLKNNLRKH